MKQFAKLTGSATTLALRAFVRPLVAPLVITAAHKGWIPVAAGQSTTEALATALSVLAVVAWELFDGIRDRRAAEQRTGPSDDVAGSSSGVVGQGVSGEAGRKETGSGESEAG